MPDRTYGQVVAIPARNEVDLLPLCLRAIAAQHSVAMEDVAVVVAANNCSDDTALVARAMELPFALYVEEVDLPASIAHAGGARRRAMDRAAELCAGDGVILTTDADGRPDPDWLASYRKAFAPGVAAAAGRVSTDWAELSQFPQDVLDVGAREWAYQAMSAQLEALCDPVAHDPWPNHNQQCGANAAITRVWYEKVGGLPMLRTGEDGALFREVWRRDGAIRHDPAPHVTVSARLVGRAQGGMADALSSRHGDTYLCDDLLEPARDLERRALWRAAARAAFGEGELARWAVAHGADPALARAAARQSPFGEAWLWLEGAWPMLAKRRVAARDIDGELDTIRRLLTAHGAQTYCEW